MLVFASNSIDVEKIRLSMSSNAAGAFVCFEGRVRNHNHGKQVTLLEYEAYDPLAQLEFAKIIDEIRLQVDIINLQCVHRVGRLDIGECAVFIGVLAKYRKEAFWVAQYTIDELKKRVPIWKKEHYADQTSTWVNACEH